MKLLTVTVPCYNSQDYMENCINSLLTGGDRVEIIIIDDGSKDRTGAIADAYADPGIVLCSDELVDVCQAVMASGASVLAKT